MKRRVKFGLLIFLTACLLGAAGAACWLIGTTDGARWLLQTVSRHAPFRLSVRQVEGRLFDQLRLKDVRIVRAPIEIEIDKLACRWQPALLLAGRIALRELALTGVRVQDNTPGNEPPDLAWPRISGMADFFDGQIGRMQIKDLIYRRLDRLPATVAALSASLSWRQARLKLADLVALGNAGRLSGSMEADLRRPFLRLDLVVAPSQPWSGLDAMSLRGRFVPGKEDEQLAGDFKVTLWSGKLRRLELTGEAGMTSRLCNLRQLRLTRPGRRGQITGGGTITPTVQAPLLALELRTADLDLAPEINTATNINGWLTLRGTMEQYRGRFAIANRGKAWRALKIAGAYQGDAANLKFAVQQGSLLSGTVKGNLDIDWRAATSLIFKLQGRGLNPAGLEPGWRGVVNCDLAGDLFWPEQASFQGKLNGRLLESRLHGQRLTGEVAAQFIHGKLRVERLLVQGRGFNIHAQGELDKRLLFNAQVRDLSRLIPQAAGEISADGWVCRRDQSWAGDLAAQGRKLFLNGLEIDTATLSADLKAGKDAPLRLALNLRKFSYKNRQGEAATLEAEGTRGRHTLKATLHSTLVEAQLFLLGTYGREGWRGEISRFSGRDGVGSWSLVGPASLSFAAGTINLTHLIIKGEGAELLDFSGALTWETLRGSLRLVWEKLNLTRLNPWLKETRLEGTSAGNVRIDIGEKEKPAFSGVIQAMGALTAAPAGISLPRGPGSLKLEGGAKGLHVLLRWQPAGGGEVKGTFDSSGPASLAMPEEGKISLAWQGIDLALCRELLPRALNPEGRLTGRAQGKLLPGRQFTLTGDASLSQGKVRWLRPGGEMNADLKSAFLTWDWRGEQLKGTALLNLADFGQARASFQLPFFARIPPALNRRGALQVSLTAQMHEKGLLSAIFPGLIRESQGEIKTDLRVTGSWEAPEATGRLFLAKAGAYLPTAGIHVKDVRLVLGLEKNSIRIEAFHAASGSGYLAGTGLIQLKGWQVVGYRGSISGERFQALYLPELQLLITPRLTLTGSAEGLVVRGEVELPELLIAGRPAGKAVLPSKDVIIAGAAPAAAKIVPLALDIQVGVLLGDNVVVRMAGIDARWEGKIDLTCQGLDKITGRGELRVVKGRYKAYGVDLEIARGRLSYADAPINEPTLDIMALRTSGEVRAGITAGGILRAPVIKLYSEPALSEEDILAYIAFGHAASSNAEQAAVLAQMAGTLLSRGHSSVLREQIKQRLGLSTLEIQSSNGDAKGRAGYKKIPSSSGMTSTRQAGDLSQAMLTLGKYLTPRLYFSYGRSLFTGSNLFLLRYDLFKQWQIETQTGTESSVDLYYKIDFK